MMSGLADSHNVVYGARFHGRVQHCVNLDAETRQRVGRGCGPLTKFAVENVAFAGQTINQDALLVAIDNPVFPDYVVQCSPGR